MMREGQNLFVHLTLGQVFSRTVNLFADRFPLYMTLSVIVSIPAVLLGTMISAVIGMSIVKSVIDSSSTSSGTDIFGPGSGDVFSGGSVEPTFGLIDVMAGLMHHIGGVFTVVVLQMGVSAAVTLIAEGGMVRAAADTYTAQPQGWVTCLTMAAQQFVSLSGAAAIRLGVITGGFIIISIFVALWVAWRSAFAFFLVFVVMVMVMLALAYFILSICLFMPVIVVENKGPVDSIRRSFELSQGRRCYVFCGIFILWVMEMVVQQFLANLFGVSTMPLSSLLTPIGVFVSFLGNLMYMPLTAIMTLVLYTSIRVDKEGLTQDVMQRELVEPISYAPPTTQYRQDYRQVSLVEEHEVPEQPPPPPPPPATSNV